MKPPLLIVSPHFPPLRGGLADHTERLANELSAQSEVSVLTSTGAETKRPFSVYGQMADWQNATELLAAIQLAAPDGAVLWQYVPHMYGRGGVNLALPKVMAALKRQGRRQFVIAHEIAAPFALWPQRFCFALAHRWQWRQILRCADVIGISTEAWLEEWSRRAPDSRNKLCLLPSPSSIPVVPVAADHAAQWRLTHGLPVNARILAYFGTISGTKQFDWVLSAWRQAQAVIEPVVLVVIGDVPPAEVPSELRALFQAARLFAARGSVVRLASGGCARVTVHRRRFRTAHVLHGGPEPRLCGRHHAWPQHRFLVGTRDVFRG